MSFYLVEPECPGHLDEDVDLDLSSAPVRVAPGAPPLLFHGWLGDDLISTHPLYLATPPLARALSESLPGLVRVGPAARISLSEEFREFFPDTELPEFLRLDFLGRAFADDAGLTELGELVVSSRGLSCLSGFRLDQATVTEQGPEGVSAAGPLDSEEDAEFEDLTRVRRLVSVACAYLLLVPAVPLSVVEFVDPWLNRAVGALSLCLSLPALVAPWLRVTAESSRLSWVGCPASLIAVLVIALSLFRLL
ncbi:MAG: hypothetical protein R3F62_21865 [Planctomycetota bacterium]